MKRDGSYAVWEREQVDAFKPPKVAGIFATFIPDRSPAFKVHVNRGQAKTAIGYDKRAWILYELLDGKWVAINSYLGQGFASDLNGD